MPWRPLITLFFSALLAFPIAPGWTQEVLITEFMASNNGILADEDGAYSDWIELHNPGTQAVSLNGWFLTDSKSDLLKWRFPAVSIPAGGFMIVFASDKNRRDPSKPLHTSWKLSASGEYLGLVKSDGKTISSEYAPIFPPQQTDVSYGMAFAGSVSDLVSPGAAVRAIVPSSNTLGLSWTQPGFNDNSWLSGTTGVGFERSSGYESLIGLDLGSQMYGKSPTSYNRIPFTINEIPNGNLTLRMKYDDGFVAYLNGVRVASANAPSSLDYRSSATRINEDHMAVVYQDFDITEWKSSLNVGDNVLAIHGLNNGSSSSDYLILPELVGTSGEGVLSDSHRYFNTPTPGAPNGTAASDRGPEITNLSHAPNQPTASQNLLVTVRVNPVSDPISSVVLTYRVHYGSEVSIPMWDDGAHGDGDPEDGIYAATIPSSAYSAGQMVRYYVKASDPKYTSRMPLFMNALASPEYQGTVVLDPAVSSPLPVLHWFVQNTSAAGTETGTQASLFYNGVFYDNVHVRLRGNTSAYWPKKNFKFDMCAGFYFQYDPNEEPVEEFNLQSTYSDKSYMRQVLSWDTYAWAGVPGCISYHMRVHQNGAFYSVAEFLEQPDTTMLSRNGLDADGALYKMYNECTSSTYDVEKKTRQTEDNSDLQALINGINLSGTNLRYYLFDNVDVPAVINYLAATSIMHDNDHMSKNYYVYRDTENTGEWTMLPWDKDLTFGRNFVPWDGGVLADEIWADDDPYSHPLFGDATHPKVDGPWNRFIGAIYRDVAARSMYLRRLRTLMDTILQAPGTAAGDLVLEARVEALKNLISADVALDRAKWGNPYGANQDLVVATNLITNLYLPQRRNHLFVTHAAANGLVPAKQVPYPVVQFGVMAPESTQLNVDEAYLTILNPNPIPVDISNWTLAGDVTHTFRPGTVIPANSSLYVARSAKAFRKRSAAPTGGMGLFVQGDYKGQQVEQGADLRLLAPDRTIITRLAPTVPDVLQALRIAAGISAHPMTSRYDVEQQGDSQGVVDLADAIRLARQVAGLDPLTP